MSYDHSLYPLLRQGTIGYITDATTQVDSPKYAWAFCTPDVAATVEGGGYFNANPELGRGDQIHASMNNGAGATPVLKTYIVTQGKRSGDASNVIVLQTTTAG